MRRIIYYFLILLFAIALAACSSTGGIEPVASDTTDTSTTTKSSGMGNMGMGGSMMAAHHATIPEPYAGLSNPIPADEESLERGAEIYATHCATCHGDGGIGDGPTAVSLDPTPANIAHTSPDAGRRLPILARQRRRRNGPL